MTTLILKATIIIHIIIFIAMIKSCQLQSKEQSSSSSQTKKNINNDVTIELSMPYGDSLKLFGICWDNNPIDVIIRNQSDDMINFYQNWNSWGFYNFSFQIETYDSIYTIERTKNVWWKNFPSYHTINPNESLVYHFSLIDSVCYTHYKKIERIRGLKQWTGLPQKEYKQAKLRVIYKLPKEDQYLINDGFRKLDYEIKSLPNFQKSKNDTTFIYSQSLISIPLNIKLSK